MSVRASLFVAVKHPQESEAVEFLDRQSGSRSVTTSVDVAVALPRAAAAAERQSSAARLDKCSSRASEQRLDSYQARTRPSLLWHHHPDPTVLGFKDNSTITGQLFMTSKSK